MKKIPLILFVLSVLFVLSSPPSKAYAKTETSGDLQVTYDDPLFPSSIIWYPGLSVTKSITIKNLGSSTHKTEVKADNTFQTGNIADIYLFKIIETGISRYGGLDDKTLKNFWDDGQVSLSDINSDVSTIYDITITMPTNAGNECQGKTAKFDLIIGFAGTPATVTISGGGVAGAAVSAPTCSDTAPSSAPTLTSAVAGVNSVTLTWTPAGDPVSYYLVAYGTSSGVYSYGNPNVGGKGTLSYTVSGLSGGTTYYFVVRAGNGCAPGPFSNELSATPTGGFIAGLPAGFAPGVLGVATPEAKLTATPSGILGVTKPGEIKGEEVVNFCRVCFWWQILLGEIIALLLYYYLILKKYSEKIKKPLLVSSIIPIITYVVFLWLNKDCLTNYLFIQSPSFFCRYFWLVDTGTFIIFLIWRKFKLKKINS